MRGVRIRSFSGPYFPVFRLNTDQKNSKYGHFSGSVIGDRRSVAGRIEMVKGLEIQLKILKSYSEVHG